MHHPLPMTETPVADHRKTKIPRFLAMCISLSLMVYEILNLKLQLVPLFINTFSALVKNLTIKRNESSFYYLFLPTRGECENSVQKLSKCNETLQECYA